MTIKKIFLIYVILFITLAVFYPILNADFVNWDDQRYVTENDAIKDFSPRGVMRLMTSFHYGLYKPIVLISFAVEYHFFQLLPGIYHGTNLMLHLLNCILVFWLVYMMSRMTGAAFLTALFFGIHPMHAESVSWIAERKDMLYAFFFLLALIFYVRYLGKGKTADYRASLGAFFMSLLAKPMGITFPLVMFLADYYYGNPVNRKTIREKIPFVIVSAGCILVSLCAQAYAPAGEHVDFRIGAGRILIGLQCLLFYIGRMVWPAGLACSYPPPAELMDPVRGALVLAVLAAGLFLCRNFAREHKKDLIFGGLFFLITLSPVLQIFSTGPSAVADRYSYVAYIGGFYALAAVITARYRMSGRKGRLFMAGCFVAITAVCLVLTSGRVRVWQTSSSLWSDVIRKYPTLQVPYLNRGAAYLADGMFDKAIADYDVFFRHPKTQDPSFLGTAYNNRGYAYFNKGDIDRALADCDRAIECTPSDGGFYANRGVLYERKGAPDAALRDYSQAIAVSPDLLNSYIRRADIYFKRGDLDKSIADYDAVVKKAPWHHEAIFKRGLALNRKGEFVRAANDYAQATAMSPDYVRYYAKTLFFQYRNKKHKEALRTAALLQAIGGPVPEKTFAVLNKIITAGDSR
ncbi:MAG: tetratricopeptide repeat protein [Candidatus Omnitrophica bacterium]|nr:tetratricopeptide repeat protein [Candidatus Omnitrophota bacterium]